MYSHILVSHPRESEEFRFRLSLLVHSVCFRWLLLCTPSFRPFLHQSSHSSHLLFSRLLFLILNPQWWPRVSLSFQYVYSSFYISISIILMVIPRQKRGRKDRVMMWASVSLFCGEKGECFDILEEPAFDTSRWGNWAGDRRILKDERRNTFASCGFVIINVT